MCAQTSAPHPFAFFFPPPATTKSLQVSMPNWEHLLGLLAQYILLRAHCAGKWVLFDSQEAQQPRRSQSKRVLVRPSGALAPRTILTHNDRLSIGTKQYVPSSDVSMNV